MTVHILKCYYIPVMGEVETGSQMGEVVLSFRYGSRLHELALPVIKIDDSGQFMYHMPPKWGDIFGLEAGYSKPIAKILGRVVRGEAVDFPITLEPLWSLPSSN
jgi:hypothetical protein